jgi:predicted DNA-binding antitoxin AbrB/MazE fold protein
MSKGSENIHRNRLFSAVFVLQSGQSTGGMVMVVSVRAVYQEGQLKLLDPVDLAEGQIVDVTIQSESPPVGLTPEQVDTRLRSAGVLLRVSTTEDAVELSPENDGGSGRYLQANAHLRI